MKNVACTEDGGFFHIKNLKGSHRKHGIFVIPIKASLKVGYFTMLKKKKSVERSLSSATLGLQLCNNDGCVITAFSAGGMHFLNRCLHHIGC